ncbi:MAG: hypothetical protein JST21_17000 [Bacteroidetes bacterium]|nr:hypothetical protein [Bacteroidota bacterium]
MKLVIYRVFSFLLLPIALIFTISVMLFLRAAIANPAMLFPLFLLSCISIYTFASLNFLIRGIDGKKLLGKSSKDWLKVNAIASAVFAALMISQCIVLLFHPEILQNIAAQAKENAGEELKMSPATLQNYLRGTSYFFLMYASILLVHIILGFQYLKEYSYLFRNEEK